MCSPDCIIPGHLFSVEADRRVEEETINSVVFKDDICNLDIS